MSTISPSGARFNPDSRLRKINLFTLSRTSSRRHHLLHPSDLRKMSRQGSVANAGNATGNPAKDVVEQQHGGPLHFPVEDELQHSESFRQTIAGAKAATDKEHKMTLLQGIRLYPKAIIFSVIISTCIAMEGYDVSLINNFYGFPMCTLLERSTVRKCYRQHPGTCFAHKKIPPWWI